MDKMDSVMMTENVLDKIRGGKTVAIRSTSGLIKFPWVWNADEYVNAALAQIEIFKKKVQTVTPAEAPVASKSPASSSDKIRDLKKLLDDGLISQEEYEEKRKELLANM